MPFRKLFLSRWSALLWAGGVLWTAVDVAGVAPATPTNQSIADAGKATDATGAAVNSADLAILANVMKGD